MEKSNSHETLRNVKCEVETCQYNNCRGNCTANAIEVTPRSTLGFEGTDCATFVKRKNCSC